MRLDRLDVYFWALLVVSGFVMYYVYIVVNPTFQIVSNTNELANDTNGIVRGIQDIQEQNTNRSKAAEKNVVEILKNQDNNTQILKQLIQENRRNQEQSIYYLLTVLNQSNIIGNKTADEIQQNINAVKTLEINQTQQIIGLQDRLEALVMQQQNSRNANGYVEFISSSTDANVTGNISGYLGGPLITDEDVAELNANISAQAQNQSQFNASKYGTPS